MSYLCPDFSQNVLSQMRSTLSETSIDSSNGAKTPLVDQNDVVYNFDTVARTVCRRYRGDSTSSCDALYDNNGKYYLLEFKNQSETNVNRSELKKKAFDSVAILQNTFCWKMSREELAQRLVLVVVYNDRLEERASFLKFREKARSLAKEEKNGILFDLKKLRTLYSSIVTVTKDTFDKEIYPTIFTP